MFIEQSLNVISLDRMKVSLVDHRKWKGVGKERQYCLKLHLAKVGSQVLGSMRYGPRNRRLLFRFTVEANKWAENSVTA